MDGLGNVFCENKERKKSTWKKGGVGKRGFDRLTSVRARKGGLLIIQEYSHGCLSSHFLALLTWPFIILDELRVKSPN